MSRTLSCIAVFLATIPCDAQIVWEPIGGGNTIQFLTYSLIHEDIYISADSLDRLFHFDGTRWATRWFMDGTISHGVTSLYAEIGFVILSTKTGGVFISLGKEIEANEGLITKDTGPFVRDTDGTYYLATRGDGIARSYSRGYSWYVTEEAKPDSNIHCIAITQDNVLYAGGNSGVYRSMNRGNSWQKVSGVPSVAVLAVAVTKDGDVFAATASSVYRLLAGANEFEDITARIGALRVKAFHAAPNGTVFAVSPLGVHLSTDKGDSWSLRNEGLQNTDVRFIAQDEQGALFIGTHGAGVYRSNTLFGRLQPTAPRPITPARNTTFRRGDRMLFSWERIGGSPQFYHLQVSSDSLFGRIDFEVNNVTTPEYMLPYLPNNTMYFWRVRQFDSVFTQWSERWWFTTGYALPAVPQLRFPNNDTTGLDTQVAFQWQPSPNTDSYEVQIDTSMAFDRNPVILPSATPALHVTNLLQWTKYSWRVRGINPEGRGEWSETWNFTTGGINSVASPASLDGYVLEHGYPHPFSEKVTILFSLPSRSVIEIKIFDVLGREAYSMHLGSLGQGQHLAMLYPEGLPDGFYRLHLFAGGRSVNGRSIVKTGK